MCRYVYRAKDRRTGEQVALKRLIFHKESSGFPLCSIREIKFLKSLNHKNVVALKEIVTSKGTEHLDSNVSKKSAKTEHPTIVKGGDDPNKDKGETVESNRVVQLCGNLYLVFEYIDHDLGGLVDSKYKFSQRSIKCIAKQLFEALDYLNEKKIIHRDIKTSNLLLSNRHQLKLADFGLARSSIAIDGREGKVDLTNNVVTMWYKSPELLLGSVRYSSAIDIWSSGCVLAELELGRPIFPGKTELEQFDLISKILGSPNEENWVGLTSLPNYDTFIKNMAKYPNILRSAYDKKISDQALSLLERAFVLDPDRRPSAKIILTHSYFFSYPIPPANPADLDPLQIVGSLHEYETKLKRKLAAQQVAENSSAVLTASVSESINLASITTATIPTTFSSFDNRLNYAYSGKYSVVLLYLYFTRIDSSTSHLGQMSDPGSYAMPCMPIPSLVEGAGMYGYGGSMTTGPPMMNYHSGQVPYQQQYFDSTYGFPPPIIGHMQHPPPQPWLNSENFASYRSFPDNQSHHHQQFVPPPPQHPPSNSNHYPNRNQNQSNGR